MAEMLARRRIADTETPVSAMLKLGLGNGPSFLLESVEGGAALGRYSFIGIRPDIVWKAHGAACAINRTALADPDAFVPMETPSLQALRALTEECRIAPPEGIPGTIPTLVGYMGYECAGLVEKLPAPKDDPIGVPDMLFIRPSLLLVFDRLKDELILVAPVYSDTDAAHERAREALDAAEAALDGPLPAQPDVPDAGEPVPQPMLPPGRYADMVARAKDYITAGDIFQVVLAQRFTQPFVQHPFTLYRALRRVNPSPFLFYLDMPGFAVAGSSPEILVRARHPRPTAPTATACSPTPRNWPSI
jgi:anthranilate synthase component I